MYFLGSSTASFTTGLVQIFKASTIKIFLSFLREVAAGWGRSGANMKERLLFVKFGYLLGDIF